MPTPLRQRSLTLENDPLEMRAAPRVGADFPVRIHSRDFPMPLVARTRDLSVDGACLATASPFAVKSLQRIEVQLPGQNLLIEAEGCWQRDEPVDDLVLTGVVFPDPRPETREILWNTVLQSGQQLARFLYERSSLRELGLEEAMGLAHVTRYRHVSAGRTLYRQDCSEPGEDSIFLVTEGRVTLQVRVRNAREVDFAVLESGELFGGFPLVADLAHTESAVADSDCCLLEIDRTAYRYLCSARPWLAQRLSTALVRVSALRLRNLYARCHAGT